MILSDIELLAELDAKRVSIDPLPPRERINASSVDMTLDNTIWEYPQDPVAGIVIDPANPKVRMRDIISHETEEIVIPDGQPYILKPNRLTLAQTHEVIRLPLHLSARIEGKSSLARLGISIHATAPTVLPGFNGRLTLEMNNIGPFEIMLTPGMLIAQLIIERVGLPSLQGYQGQFQGQR